MAVASLILGICSYLCFGPLCSIPGTITGAVALSRIRKARPAVRGEGLAIAGIILSGINLALCMLLLPALLLPGLARAREAARRASCANNLKQVGLVMKMFSNESKGAYYPALSPEPGKLMFENDPSKPRECLFPEYLSDLQIMACPSDSDAELVNESNAQDPAFMLDDRSYFYLGYALTSDEDVEAFAEAYRATTAAGGNFEGDLNTAGGVIRRLRERMEIESSGGAASDAAASAAVNAVVQVKAPIFIERVGNHIPGGGNVVYMNGRVEFIKYPGKWPMTERTISVLQALDGGFWPPREVDFGN
jgi:hypothetical protein